MVTLVGIFVGGASSRMGSPKGLLRHPEGGTLLEHAVREIATAGLGCALVGAAEPYVDLVPEVPRLADAFIGAGPIGGLRALVSSEERAVISIACDMPFVTAEVLRALADDPRTGSLAARSEDGAYFEPMLARWEPRAARSEIDAARARGETSLQRLLVKLQAGTFVPTTRGAVTDWDTPADLERGNHRS